MYDVHIPIYPSHDPISALCAVLYQEKPSETLCSHDISNSSTRAFMKLDTKSLEVECDNPGLVSGLKLGGLGLSNASDIQSASLSCPFSRLESVEMCFRLASLA